MESKAALLDGIAEAVLEDMPIEIDATAPWIERAHGLARAFRRVALKHPESFPLVFTRQLKSGDALRGVGMSFLLGAARPALYIAKTGKLRVQMFPRVTRIAPLLATCDHEAEYEFDL